MLKILLLILLPAMYCHAGFKAAIGLDFKADVKDMFYDLMSKSSDQSFSNYLYQYKTVVDVPNKKKKGTFSKVEKEIFKKFSIFNGRSSNQLINIAQKEIKKDGVDYRLVKEKQTSSQDLLLAQDSSDLNKFREIQPGEIITTYTTGNISKRSGITQKIRKVVGIYGRSGTRYFITEQKDGNSVEHVINDRQPITINGIKYTTYRIKLTSKFNAIQQKKYKNIKDGFLKLNNTQQKELMRTLFILLDGIGDDAWVTHNSIQVSMNMNSQKYSKSELLNDIIENLKSDPKKHYPALMKFFEFLNVNQWKRDLTHEGLNERLNLIKILKSIFFIKRANLNDYLNVMISFYDKTLYAKTLSLKDKINLIACEQITNVNDFRSFFPLMRGVTILKYEGDVRQRQVHAVGKLIHYVKQIIDENNRQYGTGKVPVKVIDAHVAAISREWKRLQRDMHEKPVLAENVIGDLLNSVASHSERAMEKGKKFNSEEADPADIDALAEKFEDDDAFQDWKASIEAEQKAEKPQNKTAQEAAIIARIENDESASADDIQAMADKTTSSKVKRKIETLAEERLEEQEEREEATAKKRNQVVVVRKVEAVIAAAIQDGDVALEDLEALAGKVTSPVAKRKIADAIVDRVEVDEEREVEEARKRNTIAAAQKAETAAVAAVQNDDVTSEDLEALASKAHSQKAKLQIEEAFAIRDEEREEAKKKQQMMKHRQYESREIARIDQDASDLEMSDDDLENAVNKVRSPKVKAQIEEALAARAEEKAIAKTAHKSTKSTKAKKHHSYDDDETDFEDSDSDDDWGATRVDKNLPLRQGNSNQPKVRKPRSEMTREEKTVHNREKRQRQKEYRRNRVSQTIGGE